MKKTTNESVSFQVEEQFLYESIVSVMTRLFLPDNMNSYACCYDILGRTDIKGRRATADLMRIFSEKGISIEKKRLEMFRLCESDVCMRKKWEHYVKVSGKTDAPAWEEVYGRINDFITPLWTAICEDEFYLCDWIGGLGRYMD